MKRLSVFFMAIIVLLSLLTGCRPPEIEGAYVDLAGNRLDDALANAQAAVEKYPQNSEAWYILGSIQGKKENYSEMAEAFEKSLAIDTQFQNKIKQERDYYFQETYNKGVNKYNSFTQQIDRSSEEAKSILRDGLKNFLVAGSLKNDYSAVSLAGLCYTLLEEKENALAQYKKLTEMRPDTADAWVNLGQYYYNAKDYDQSGQALEKALEIEPENPNAVSMLAQVYGLTDQKDKAIELYAKAVELMPEEKVFPFNLGLMYFQMSTAEGVTEAEKNEYLQKTADNMTKVLNLDPEMKEAYDLQTNSLILLGKYDEAVPALKTAIDYFPEEYNFWFNLGVSYTRMNNVDEAKKAFAKADKFKE